MLARLEHPTLDSSRRGGNSRNAAEAPLGARSRVSADLVLHHTVAMKAFADTPALSLPSISSLLQSPTDSNVPASPFSVDFGHKNAATRDGYTWPAVSHIGRDSPDYATQIPRSSSSIDLSTLIDLSYTVCYDQRNAGRLRQTTPDRQLQLQHPPQWGAYDELRYAAASTSAASSPILYSDYPPLTFPPPASSSTTSHPSTSTSTPRPRRTPANTKETTSADGTKKACAHCHVTSTPSWRREARTGRTLCNACGLYLVYHGSLRPQRLIAADADALNDAVPDDEYAGLKCTPRPRRATANTKETTNADGTKKACAHCQVTSAPSWRREARTGRTLCNACGLYLVCHGFLRPQRLIAADADAPKDAVPDDEYAGLKCGHCGTRTTSVWRRTQEGGRVCNACGLYAARLRRKPRPLTLHRNKIKPRTKHAKNAKNA